MTPTDIVDERIIENLKHFSGDGFFDLPKEEQTKYENTFYKVARQILDEVFEIVPNGTTVIIFLEHMEGIKDYYRSIEDYEMLYLIDNATKRCIKYYEDKHKNR